MTTPKRREQKYQVLRGHHSNRLFASDSKLDFRAVATVADEEYTMSGDIKDSGKTLDIFDKIDKLTATRDIRKTRALLRLKPKPVIEGREEKLAKLATRFGGTLPHNFARYGFLVARDKKRKNPPRPGSSAGKISKTRYKGFKEFNRDWSMLEKRLLNLTKDRKLNRKVASRLRAIKSSISASPG